MDIADAEVVQENGQWTIFLTIYFSDQIVRKRIATYRTEQLANTAASLIQRAANRSGL